MYYEQNIQLTWGGNKLQVLELFWYHVYMYIYRYSLIFSADVKWPVKELEFLLTLSIINTHSVKQTT